MNGVSDSISTLFQGLISVGDTDSSTYIRTCS